MENVHYTTEVWDEHTVQKNKVNHYVLFERRPNPVCETRPINIIII